MRFQRENSRVGFLPCFAFIVCIPFLLLLVACGGGGSAVRYDPLEETPTRLVSSDGLITAIIPVGAVTTEAEFYLVNRTAADKSVPGPVGRELPVSLKFSAEDKSKPEPETLAAEDAAEGDGGGANGTSQAEPVDPPNQSCATDDATTSNWLSAVDMIADSTAAIIKPARAG